MPIIRRKFAELWWGALNKEDFVMGIGRVKMGVDQFIPGTFRYKTLVD